MIVSINSYVGRGENFRLPYGVHVVRTVPKRGCELIVAEGVALNYRRGYVLFEGETVALCHRPDLGRDKNAEKLA